jgi:hypothetical protein
VGSGTVGEPSSVTTKAAPARSGPADPPRPTGFVCAGQGLLAPLGHAGYIVLVPDELPNPRGAEAHEPVVVIWCPGVSRERAHGLITGMGLASLGLPEGAAHVVMHCVSCGSSGHGRPVLVGSPEVNRVHISISYADDLTLVALTAVGRVGVDVERHEAASFRGVSQVVGDVGAADRGSETVSWVRLESLLKATWRGLTVDPRLVRLSAPGEMPTLVSWMASDPPRLPAWMFDIDLTAEHTAAVTVLSVERPQLVVRRADPEARPGRASGQTRTLGQAHPRAPLAR